MSETPAARSPSAARLLAAFPALQGLDRGALDDLLRGAVPLRAPAGAAVFSELSPCHGFPLVLDGSIRVAKTAANGREILLYRVEPGDVCVLTTGCLLGGADYPAGGSVERDLEALVLPRPVFAALLDRCAPFREMVFGQFAGRITELMTLVEAVAFQRLDQRMAALLLARGPAVEATHQALAEELGSVREIVSRILGSFEDRALVSLGRARITVRDPAGLAAIAEGD